MTTGFFSPLPPAPTGVAAYSAALLQALRGPDNVVPNLDGDLNLYHLGNNALHGHIYDRALAKPGVVVLHDGVLNHFMLGHFERDAYVAEFTHNYGVWSEDLARRLWSGRARSAADPLYFRYPMLRRVVERSLAVVVHNARAAALAREHGAVNVHVIPHLFEPPFAHPHHEVLRLRERLGVGTHGTLFAVLGHLRESKRISTIVRAFSGVRHAHPGVKLLIAGEFVSSDLPLALGDSLNADGIVRVGFLNDADFLLHAAATDVCVNLRWPSAGETSGIAVRLMGMDKCVIVTSGGETGDIPEQAIIRVDSGPAEEEMLTAFMTWLAANPDKTRAIGANAGAHIRQFHSIDRAAAEYRRVLADCYHKQQSSAP